jgi:hypothetical protein
MDDLITFFVLCCIGWTLGVFLSGFIDGYHENNLLIDESKAYISKILHRVDAIKEQDIHYWFDLDNGQFLAQGKNLDEVIGHLKSRFPDHLFCLYFDNRDHLVAAVTNWKVEKIDEDKVIEVAKNIQ